MNHRLYWQSCAAALAVAWAGSAQARNLQAWTHALDFAGQQLQNTAAKIAPTESPKATDSSGTWSLIQNTDPTAWTQGFFPGSLWYLFEQTGNTTFKDLATQWTAPLEIQKTNTATHDLGFKLYPSFGHAYELTGTDSDRQVLLTAAASLATRYQSNPGVITMGNWNPNWKMPIVIDTMMNIELLEWAAHNGGDPAWEQMAISHATITLRDLVRPDGSTYHVADYDPTTGQLRWRGTFQGYSDSSTWARGQVWAMYGFTMMYRYTKRPEFLDAARRTTALFLSRLPADSIPPWDFDAPNAMKDSSAASAAAAALLDLAELETDQATATKERSVAETILDTLSGSGYLAEGTNSEGALLHGVGNYPANQEIDVSLIYGDYYFLEALVHAMKTGGTTPPTAPPSPSPTPPGSSASTTPPPATTTPAPSSTPSPSSGSPSPNLAGTGCGQAGWGGAILGLLVALFSRRRRRA